MLNRVNDEKVSLGELEAKAYASDAYHAAMQDLENAIADFETLKARRDACDIAVEFWRSIHSASKQGLNLS
jgi:hypothetical protein